MSPRKRKKHCFQVETLEGRIALSSGVSTSGLKGVSAVPAVVAAAGIEQSFGFDVRRWGWSTYERHTYVAAGGPVFISFTDKAHAIKAMLTDPNNHHDRSGIVSWGDKDFGKKLMARLSRGTPFKLTMDSPSDHVVRVQGVVYGVLPV